MGMTGPSSLYGNGGTNGGYGGAIGNHPINTLMDPYFNDTFGHFESNIMSPRNSNLIMRTADGGAGGAGSRLRLLSTNQNQQ